MLLQQIPADADKYLTDCEGMTGSLKKRIWHDPKRIQPDQTFNLGTCEPEAARGHVRGFSVPDKTTDTMLRDIPVCPVMGRRDKESAAFDIGADRCEPFPGLGSICHIRKMTESD